MPYARHGVVAKLSLRCLVISGKSHKYYRPRMLNDQNYDHKYMVLARSQLWVNSTSGSPASVAKYTKVNRPASTSVLRVTLSPNRSR